MKQVQFTDTAFQQFTEWANFDRKTFNKIARLIEECKRDPFHGTGKPEALKHNRQGYWSRRISDEHRLVYQVTEEIVLIIACRSHYE
jgi:toxin YoeB